MYFELNVLKTGEGVYFEKESLLRAMLEFITEEEMTEDQKKVVKLLYKGFKEIGVKK